VKKGIIFFLLCLSSVIAFAQQDGQISQYVFNGLYINPAYAGYKEQTNIHTFYRSQWTGFKGAPNTMSLAGDMVTNNGNVGLGVMLSSDNIGAQSNFSAYVNYAYRIQVGQSEFSRLSFGLAAGIVQQGIDGEKLRGNDADTYIPVGKPTEAFPDARAGIFYSTPRVFAGLSADNLIASYVQKDNHSNSIPLPKINKHFYFTAGALFPVNDAWKFKPTILLKDNKQTFTSLDLNAFALLYETIWIGAFYRTAVPLYKKAHLDPALQKTNGLGVITELFVSDKLRIGYSFDYSLSDIRDYNYGSHEISIGFSLSPRRSEGPICYF
jgi:type IX secretion system PorP/SprF family membrane protein